VFYLVHNENTTLTQSFTLDKNIVFYDVASWNDGDDFLPVGTDSRPWLGTLNSNNHTLI
jgi:hypothetical protein